MRRPSVALASLVAGAILAASILCSVARADVLRPYWTGPVWGAFTDAGPDSVDGAKAEVNVPIGVQLTNPFRVLGYDVTLRANFRWTTKAWLGAESDPLRDATYQWYPAVRIQPDSADGFFRYTEAGPYHESNGAEASDSRSMNAFRNDWAFVYSWRGIEIDAYVSLWWVYDFGTNTEPLRDTITLVEDFGAKLLVRGSVDVIQVAAELGPDWQKLMAYVPLNDFYRFGFFGEVHVGEGNSFLDPNLSQTVAKIGVTLEPPRL